MTPFRLAVMTAVLPTVGFLSAIVYIYGQPLPDWAMPPPEEVPIVLPDPTYLELEQPIQVGLYGGRIQVTLNLAFSARAEPLVLLDLGAKIKELESAIMADLISAVLKEGEAIDSSQGLAKRLREVLPPILRQVVNTNLASEEQPEPVDEVLILDIAIQSG